MRKAYKQISFWEQYKGGILGKAAKEEIKRRLRKYNKHRGKAKKETK